jgi:broad specificity phosphatase PhoE
MKISLIRHGRPDADLISRIAGHQFPEWLRRYEEAGVDRLLPPPDELRKSVAQCRVLASSPAARAQGSADLLELLAQRIVFPDASEAPLPTRIICPMPLKPATMTVVARVLWLLGLASASEDKTAVQRRACRLADDLSMLARTRGHVALVGHGYMTRFLTRALKASGWRCTSSAGSGYWSDSHFEPIQLAITVETSAFYGAGKSFTGSSADAT